MARILVLGDPVWDLATYLDRPLGRGEYTPAGPLKGRPGGSAANIARALASARHEVWIHGAIGTDEAGQKLLADLVERHVRCDWLRQVPGQSRTCLVLVEPDGERSIIGIARPHDMEASLPHGEAPDFDTVYIGDAGEPAAAILRWLCRHRVPTIVAHVGTKGLKAPVGIPVHYVLSSEEDLPELWRAGPWEMARVKAGPALRGLAVTQGANGVVAYTEGGRKVSPGVKLPRPVQDSTGAGDAFAAGVIHAISSEGSLEAALGRACRWGAAATQVRASVPPPLDEVESILLGQQPALSGS